MHSTLKRARKILRGVGSVLILMIGMGIFLLVTAKPEYRTIRIARGEHPVQISAAHGVVPNNLLLSEKDTIKWTRTEPGGFSVDFDPPGPFEDHATHFDEVHNTSKPAIAATGPADVYKYSITVDGKKTDPHVIIVGVVEAGAPSLQKK
jgi:hypothetical protein